MTLEEMAWEFVEVFDDLDTKQINEMLAKNIPFETIEFFSRYAEAFADGAGIKGETRGRLPNLLLFGYLIRLGTSPFAPSDAGGGTGMFTIRCGEPVELPCGFLDQQCQPPDTFNAVSSTRSRTASTASPWSSTWIQSRS